MSSRGGIFILAVIVVAVGLTIRWMEPSGATHGGASGEKQVSNHAVVRYAMDDFIVGCRVRPEKLIEHEFFGSLPIHGFLPDRLSLGRLRAMQVEELAVFCGPTTAQSTDGQSAGDIEWAAAARTSSPLELAAVIRQWNQSLVPQGEESDAAPTAVRIEDHDCFRVPAGSFFAPSRTYGTLRFTDRHGEPVEQGINVGNIDEYRGYVEGATKSAAIFTLEHIEEADLIDGHLPLEIRPDVFLTSLLEDEYSIAQLELRNPDTGVRSRPIRFEPKSHVNHRLTVPRKLTAVDGAVSRQVDLLEDLVSKGRLEVILTAAESGVYLGVGSRDLNVRREAFEYVFISGPEIVVAQSPGTLARMLKSAAAPSSLAGRLAQLTGDIVLSVQVRNDSQRRALHELLRTIDNGDGVELLGDALTGVDATLRADRSAVARVTATFRDGRSASRAVTRCNRLVRTAKSRARETIGDSLNRLDVLGRLSSIGCDGVSMRFPDEGSPTPREREAHLLRVIDDSLDSIRVDSDGSVLTLDFTQPQSLSRLAEAGQIALANMEEVLARDLFSGQRFDLGDEMYRRVTSRFPHVPQAWFRRAHQLTYNVSVEFNGFETRYAWVRRGIEVLLDGAEQNPGTTDLIWMAARSIGWKIGTADERAAYRRLFSEDAALHRRLTGIVDLDQARSPDGELDNWLVARSLFEHCIERHTKSDASSSIPPLVFFSRPAAAQARYAHGLSESGRWEEARRAWRDAERLHIELGGRAIPLETADRIRLNDLKKRLAEAGPDDAAVKQLQAARQRIQYDYWLTRCRLEQTELVQSARKLAREAGEHEKRAEYRKALESYSQSLQSLAELHEGRPQEMALVAGEFKHIAKGYRSLAEAFTEAEKEPIAAILTLVEESQSVSTLPLLDPEQAEEFGLRVVLPMDQQ